jgi:hypothetical protein
MEIPAKVSVFNTILDIKGKVGTLIAIREDGYYEISLEVKDRNVHTVLLPIGNTVLVFNEPLPQATAGVDIER